MARPVEFEYEKVLSNAMEQFWKEGYEASSVQKLLDCTGINRGTLYNSFGDKDTFFRACMEFYNKGVEKNLEASLKNSTLSAWDAINRFFQLSVTEASNKHRGMGCLLVNSLCESINYDRELKKLIRNSLAVIRKGLLDRVREAQKNGRLRKGITADFAADVLMNTLHGLRVNSRDGASPAQMASLVSFTLETLKKK
ncbi:MAG: TetR/AcrR family transcriptional regulator [Pseudohongiellaceae bacterium]